jgi:hypothetical protein
MNLHRDGLILATVFIVSGLLASCGASGGAGESDSQTGGTPTAPTLMENAPVYTDQNPMRISGTYDFNEIAQIRLCNLTTSQPGVAIQGFGNCVYTRIRNCRNNWEGEVPLAPGKNEIAIMGRSGVEVNRPLFMKINGLYGTYFQALRITVYPVQNLAALMILDTFD